MITAGDTAYCVVPVFAPELLDDKTNWPHIARLAQDALDDICGADGFIASGAVEVWRGTMAQAEAEPDNAWTRYVIAYGPIRYIAPDVVYLVFKAQSVRFLPA
jgi:hypothetical protein